MTPKQVPPIKTLATAIVQDQSHQLFTFIAGSLESQLIGLFSVRQFFRDWWRGAFSQYIFRNVLMFLGVVLSNVAGKVIICDKNVSASGGGRFQKLSSISSISSRDLKTVEHIEQGLENCRGIELSSRDLKTVAISVTRALSNVVGKVIICDKKERQCEWWGAWPKNCRAYRAYRAGTWKLSSISSRDLKTVEVSNYWAGTWKLSQYRSLEHCPMWRGKSSYAITTSVRVVGAWPKNCRADQETVEVSNYRAGTSKLSQYRSLELSYTVSTHGLHVWALALRHSPLQAT